MSLLQVGYSEPPPHLLWTYLPGSFTFRLNSSFTQSMTIPPPLLLSRANLLQSKMDLYFSFDQDDAADYDER